MKAIYVTEEMYRFLGRLNWGIKSHESDNTEGPIWVEVHHDVEKECPLDEADKVYLADPDDDDTKIWIDDTIRETARQYLGDAELEEIIETTVSGDINQKIAETLQQDHGLIEIGVRTVREREEALANSFLTREACEKHIRENLHRYGKNPRPYVQHLWRNPEMTWLINAIKDIGRNDEEIESLAIEIKREMRDRYPDLPVTTQWKIINGIKTMTIWHPEEVTEEKGYHEFMKVVMEKWNYHYYPIALCAKYPPKEPIDMRRLVEYAVSGIEELEELASHPDGIYVKSRMPGVKTVLRYRKGNNPDWTNVSNDGTAAWLPTREDILVMLKELNNYTLGAIRHRPPDDHPPYSLKYDRNKKQYECLHCKMAIDEGGLKVGQDAYTLSDAIIQDDGTVETDNTEVYDMGLHIVRMVCGHCHRDLGDWDDNIAMALVNNHFPYVEVE